MIYKKHYKQSSTKILNDQLHYKTHTPFDKITHASHTNISATPIPMNQEITPSQSIIPGLQSIDMVHMVLKNYC